MDNTLTQQRRMERHHRRSEGAAHAIRRAVEDQHDSLQHLEERLIFGAPAADPPGGGSTGGGNTGTGGGGGGGGAGASGPSKDPKTTAPEPTQTRGSDGPSSYPGGFQPGPGGGQGATTREPTPTTTREASTRAPETSTTPTSTPEAEPTTTRTRTVSATKESTTTVAPSSTSSREATTTTPTSTMQTSFSFSASGPPTTSVRYVTGGGLLLPTSTGLAGAAASGTSSAGSSSNGPGVGPIIGIVAGALAGVAVLAVLIGFIVRKVRNKEDPYEANPFDKDEFRRHSAMIPDTFESDDGHNAMPPMSEHYNNFPPAAGGMGGGYDSGMAGAGMAGAIAAGGLAAGGAGAYAAHAHNENGGPRPPTMFERHINGPAAQFNASSAEAVPQVGAIYSNAPPSMPSMAYGGGDPYSIAGVGRSRGNDNLGQLNSVNPYAHLDRNHSDAGYQSAYSDLDRNGSHGSGSSGAMASAMPMQPAAQEYQQHHDDSLGQFDTAGRPGTAEGRSGTPDIPNVQQTYAMGGEDEEGGVIGGQRVASPVAMAEHQYLGGFAEGGFQAQQQLPPSSQQHQFGSPQQQPLQIRNLMPSADTAHGPQGGARPYSTASSVGADPDDAYGGVY